MTTTNRWALRLSVMALAISMMAVFWVWAAKTQTACAQATCPVALSRIISQGLVVNDDGADSDSRLEGDTNTNLQAWDASLDSIGLGADDVAGAFLGITGYTTNRAGVTSVGRELHAPAGTFTQTNAAITTLAIGGRWFIGAPTFAGSNATQVITDVATGWVAAPVAGTNMTFTRSYTWVLGDAGTAVLWVNNDNDSTDAAGGIVFGSGRDTNLYRSAANTLRTDDDFVAGAITGTTIDATTDFTIGTTVITDDTVVMGTTANMVNTVSTTVNAFGAATTINVGAAVSATTWTGQSLSFTGANGSNNTTFTVTNSTNSAASHSIVDVAIGGTTSTGRPQYRLTTPGGISWYLAGGTLLQAGTGTTVGSNYWLRVVGTDQNNAGIEFTPFSTTGTIDTLGFRSGIVIAAHTATVTNTGTEADLVSEIEVQGFTIAQSGGAITVNKATAISLQAPIEGTTVTLADASAIRILNTSGTPTSQYGIFVEALTAGETNYAFYNAGSAANYLGTGITYINDTANTFMTTGLTIQQSAADNEAQAWKSSDVGHAMTSLAEADTVGTIDKAEGTSGGLRITGYKDADGAAGNALVLLGGLGETADTTHTASGIGIVTVNAAVTDGATALTTVGANGNLFVVQNASSARFIVDAEGDLFADGSDVTVYDHEQDINLLRDLRICQTEGRNASLNAKYGTQPQTYTCGELEAFGFITMNTAAQSVSRQAPVHVEGRPVFDLRQKVDAQGQPLYEQLVIDDPVLDELGQPVLDEQGKPKSVRRPVTERKAVAVERDVQIPVQGQAGRFVKAKQEVVEEQDVPVYDLTKPITELVPVTQTVTDQVDSPPFWNLTATGRLTMDALRQLAEDTDAAIATLTARIAALEAKVP